jgi:glycosyltransferase involved in cell wall biosynthesis
MKYSIVMPYYNRPELVYTLETYADFYSSRKDLEIIIVEDCKNYNDKGLHDSLMSLIDKFKDTLDIKVFMDPKLSYNPSSKYNLGVQEASGEVIMLTSPEIAHTSNILKTIDKEMRQNLYIVCACKAIFMVERWNKFTECLVKFHMWYQHTKYRNACYHFCSFITKLDYTRIGGFNEEFCAGIAYDDDNFIKRVHRAGLLIVPNDDLISVHVEHSRSYDISPEEYIRLTEVNKKLWMKQLATNKF